MSAEACFCNSLVIGNAVTVILCWFGAGRERMKRAVGLQWCYPWGSVLYLSVPGVFGANPSIWESSVRLSASSVLCALPVSRTASVSSQLHRNKILKKPLKPITFYFWQLLCLSSSRITMLCNAFPKLLWAHTHQIALGNVQLAILSTASLTGNHHNLSSSP